MMTRRLTKHKNEATQLKASAAKEAFFHANAKKKGE